MPRQSTGPKLRANEKRGGTFYIYWTDERGRSRERSTGTRDLAEAHRAFAEWLGQRAEPLRWDGPRRAAAARIADVLAIYAEEHAAEHTASPATVHYAIKALLGWWGERTCDYVNPQTCRAYVKARAAPRVGRPERDDRRATAEWSGEPKVASAPPSAQRGVAASTAARELTVLRAALGYAHRNGKLLERPFVELPPRPPGRDRWLTIGEAAGLLRQSRRDPQARGHLPLFILLGLATGARPGALFDLRWTQIDFDRDRIDFNPPGRKRTTKGRPIIPMPRRLRWFLLRAHARAASPYVLSFRGERLASVKKSFRRARERAGLDALVIPYTLRHTAGTWLAQAGVDLRIIAGWLGHTQQRTTELYAHHHPSFMAAARKVMD
jgi:integrase